MYTKPSWLPNPVTAFETRKKTKPPADLISICVTVFNYADYLPDCLNSIATQTYKNLDLIVVDDKSEKDQSLAVATQWATQNAARFWRVSVLTHTRNQGPAAARNTAFHHAAGTKVFIIDADNEIYPRCIARLAEAQANGNFDAAYTQLEYFGNERKIGSADIWDPPVIAQENYVDVMALVNKSAWATAGGFSHIEEGWEDYDFWLKFIEAGFTAGYLPEILCRYRVHGQSRTHTDAYAAHEKLRAIMANRHPGAPLRAIPT